ncbi:hypothetical protein [Pseudomonas mucidolens]|uniref:CVNH domain-containing protein n=1 Tax=Pseudomonas mucidolens TaxID=46679 RepID=A0A1H2NLL8_9PSED|nr:hypothetical protein [Pseudomonas mucidolens]SDV06333.1 hypothetical protein SAMN05216202_4080 [Pseudomonas mucidolens]SQH31607.1 Uncharacterised protein [Pseudomonas mucidolens]
MKVLNILPSLIFLFGLAISNPVLSDDVIAESDEILQMRMYGGPHNDTCQEAWDKTGLIKQCTGGAYIQQYPAGTCVLDMACLKSGNTEKHSARYDFRLEDMPKINNCDGVLQTCPCPT